nr:hypothetical protein [Bifidobacterium callimiconis]
MESIAEHGSDLVILSIHKNSKQLSGLTVARQLRRWDAKLPLAFVSDCSDYAIHGYSVQALNFLVKPVKVAGAAQLLGMVLDSGRHHSAVITVVSERVTLRVPVASILYAESKRNRIVIHTANQDIPTYIPLSQLEASGGGDCSDVIGATWSIRCMSPKSLTAYSCLTTVAPCRSASMANPKSWLNISGI